MLTTHRKKISSLDAYSAISIVVFVISVIFQVLFNRAVVPIRSLPDEMGALYLAAQFSGRDWSYVMTHPAQFYGFLWLPLIYPFFAYISNPYTLYQWLLGMCAIVRSIPVFIAGRMMKKYYNVKSKILYTLLLFISVFGTPTRSTNIDNEPLLVVLCWAIFATIAELIYTESKRLRMVHSAMLGVYLALSMLSHTRAVVYYIAVLFTVFFVFVYCKKMIVHVPAFLGVCAVFYILAKKLISIVLISFYPVDKSTQVANTGGALVEILSNRIKDLLSGLGVSAYIDGVLSNFLGTVVFGVGLPFLIALYMLYSLFVLSRRRFINKEIVEVSDTVVNVIFPFSGLAIVMLGVGYTWLNVTISVRTGGQDASRGYFYLRYYGMFLSPLMVSFLASMQKDADKYFMRMKKYIGIYVFLYFVCILRLYKNLFSYSIGHFSPDWFYFFAPFTFRFVKWPHAEQLGGYYYVPFMLVLCAVVISIILLEKRKRELVAVIVTVGLLFQYGYSVMYWDAPFSHGDNYYQSADGIYAFDSNTGLIGDAGVLYCQGISISVQYNVQFVLTNAKVVYDYPPRSEKQYYMLLVTNDIEKTIEECSEHIVKCSGIFQLDDNEYLVVRGEDYFDAVSSAGMHELEHFDCLKYDSATN